MYKNTIEDACERVLGVYLVGEDHISLMNEIAQDVAKKQHLDFTLVLKDTKNTFYQKMFDHFHIAQKSVHIVE